MLALDRAAEQAPRRDHLRVLPPIERHSQQPSVIRPRLSLGSIDARLYLATAEKDLPRVNAGYEPEKRAFEQMLARGEQHNGHYQRVVDAWHDLLANPAASDDYLNRMAYRAGVIDQGDRYLAQREDL